MRLLLGTQDREDVSQLRCDAIIIALRREDEEKRHSFKMVVTDYEVYKHPSSQICDGGGGAKSHSPDYPQENIYCVTTHTLLCIPGCWSGL